VKWPGRYCLTPRLPFSSGEKQFIPQSITIKDHRMKASKEMSVMTVKYLTKRHTRCGMDMAIQCKMLTATKCRIKPLSKIYVNSESMPVDSFPSSMPAGQLLPKVKAQHDCRLHIPLEDVVEDMESRIPESQSPIRSHLQRRHKCTHVVSAWKQ
jgi:hypothetical protein